MSGFQVVGMDCVLYMLYIWFGHHLLAALVKKWSRQTNIFHIAVSEMIMMLEDVAMILVIQIDVPSMVGHIMVGEGKWWESWSNYCDELIGTHPQADVVYHDPI